MIEVAAIFYLIDNRFKMFIEVYKNKKENMNADATGQTAKSFVGKEPKQKNPINNIETNPNLLLPAINKASTVRGFSNMQPHNDQQ
jgi:hypothetical protein